MRRILPRSVPRKRNNSYNTGEFGPPMPFLQGEGITPQLSIAMKQKRLNVKMFNEGDSEVEVEEDNNE